MDNGGINVKTNNSHLMGALLAFDNPAKTRRYLVYSRIQGSMRLYTCSHPRI